MSFSQRLPLDALYKLVGKELGHSSWHDIDQALIDQFAKLTLDPQPIHIDPQAAARTPFGGTIAHGFLTLSFLSVCAYEVVPVPQDTAFIVNRGFDRLRFTGAVPAGSRMRAHFILNDLQDEDKGVTLMLKTHIEVEKQSRPALVANWIIQSLRNVPG